MTFFCQSPVSFGSVSVSPRLDEAAEARENLVIQWREVCKPRRAGAMGAKRRGSRHSAISAGQRPGGLWGHFVGSFLVGFAAG